MTVAELAKRVDSLERDVASMKQRNGDAEQRQRHWLERIRCRWAGDPVLKEIIDLGREYRESMRPDDEHRSQ